MWVRVREDSVHVTLYVHSLRIAPYLGTLWVPRHVDTIWRWRWSVNNTPFRGFPMRGFAFLVGCEVGCTSRPCHMLIESMRSFSTLPPLSLLPLLPPPPAPPPPIHTHKCLRFRARDCLARTALHKAQRRVTGTTRVTRLSLAGMLLGYRAISMYCML